MSHDQRNHQQQSDRFHRSFETFTEVLAWMQIVASPLLLGLAIGAAIYFTGPSVIRLIIGIAVALLGLIIGIVWAIKKWKGKGTVWFMSRVMATPELDGKNVPGSERKKMNISYQVQSPIAEDKKIACDDSFECVVCRPAYLLKTHSKNSFSIC